MSNQQQFKAMKFKVKDEEHSKLIQEALFKVGYVWNGDTQPRTLCHNEKFLFAYPDGKLTMTKDEYVFYEKNNQEHTIVLTKIDDSYEYVIRPVIPKQNKPSFEDHPGAHCFVQGGNGMWFKNTMTYKVRPSSDGGWMPSEDTEDCYWEEVCSGQVISNWSETLEINPKYFNGQIGQAEQTQIKETQQQEESGVDNAACKKQDNQWHIDNQLPPVGTECIFMGWASCDPSKYPVGKKVKIVAHHKFEHATSDVAIFAWNGMSAISAGVGTAIAGNFKPLPTPVSKNVESILTHVANIFAGITPSGTKFHPCQMDNIMNELEKLDEDEMQQLNQELWDKVLPNYVPLELVSLVKTTIGLK